MVGYLHSGCKPRDQWRCVRPMRRVAAAQAQPRPCNRSLRQAPASAPVSARNCPFACRIGTEHEKLGFNVRDNTRIDYRQIQEVLNKLVSRFGWEPMMEDGIIIGCKLDGQSVTLEPGGQFELSGAPVDTLHQTCSEVNSHLYQVKAIGAELDLAFLGVGFDPKWDLPDVPMMPKGRYKVMRQYMPKVGSLGLDMMFRSCTIQV